MAPGSAEAPSKAPQLSRTYVQSQPTQRLDLHKGRAHYTKAELKETRQPARRSRHVRPLAGILRP